MSMTPDLSAERNHQHQQIANTPDVLHTGLQQFCIQVPATSANVGVGFDCLGLALNLTASFCFEKSTDGMLHIAGCEARFRGADNLVWTSYRHACRELGVAEELLNITIDSPIPLAGGLGSSSACIVAGIAAAFVLAGLPLDRERIVRMASVLEGHPDNVAPAVWGGLVCSFTEAGRVWTQTFEVAESLRFVALIPPYELRTADARRVLPAEIPFSTAVWQTGRCIALVRALETGDSALLAACAHDKLHEPYRARLIPDYEALRASSLAAGASAFVISGSGATMLAICQDEQHADAVREIVSTMESVSAAEGARRNLRVEVLKACKTGLSVAEHS